jgi:hypothetical protein
LIVPVQCHYGRGDHFAREAAILKIVRDGFEDYAAADLRPISAPPPSHQENRALIAGCGAEFLRLLDGQTDYQEDLAQLKEDLFRLIEEGCPPLDIIDLMFVCTRGWSATIPDKLKSVGLDAPVLVVLKDVCRWTADTISKLSLPSIPGPLFFLPHSLPELSEEDRAELRLQIQRLPELLRVFADLLTISQPDKNDHY